jgi:hypothetical protein
MGFLNRRTILREAEEHVGAKYVDQVLDSLYVIEKAMRHFFLRLGRARQSAAVSVKLMRTTSRLPRACRSLP